MTIFLGVGQRKPHSPAHRCPFALDFSGHKRREHSKFRNEKSKSGLPNPCKANSRPTQTVRLRTVANCAGSQTFSEHAGLFFSLFLSLLLPLIKYMDSVVEIDGEGLSVMDLVKIGYSHNKVRIASSAWEAVKRGRQVIDGIL